MEKYSKCRILAVDDQKSIISVIEELIKTRIGCEVESLTNGDAALKRLESESFDIVVTDMLMRGTHGINLVEKIRGLNRKMSIIVMTGYPDDFPYVEVIRAGADDFIIKPFRPAEMEAKIMRLLDERVLRRQHVVAQGKYLGLFELSGTGMALLDADHDTIIEVNGALCEMMGCAEEELTGGSILKFLGSKDQARLKEGLKILARAGKGAIGDLELLPVGRRPAIVDAAITFIEVESEKMVFVEFKDVTEKREVEHLLAEVAHKDSLTGLYNKRSFQARIEGVVANARQHNGSFVLCLIDLDNFKQCNDTYGHQIGDEVLSAIGKIILKSIRAGDSDEAFRIGGDEFVVILRDSSIVGSRAVAERMRATYAEIENYGTSLSIGLANYALGDTSAEVIRKADQALYKAKAAGKNMVHEA